MALGWLVGTASAVIAATPQYTLSSIYMGSGQSWAGSINNSGQVVGWANLYGVPTTMQYYDFYAGRWSTLEGTAYNHNAIVFQNGEVVDIGRTYEYSEATAINNLGRIVGNVGYNTPGTRAFRLGYGPLDEVVGPGFFDPNMQYTTAKAINDNNVIAGNMYNAQGYAAYIYRDNQMIDMGMLLGSPSQVRGINNQDVVVGSSSLNANGTGPAHGFAYDSRTGVATDLGTLATTAKHYNADGTWFWHTSIAWAINDRGQIAGSSSIDRPAGTSYMREHAFRWENGQMTDLGTLPGQTDSYGYGINNDGVVVGRSGQHAFIYIQGQMYDLNDLVAVPNGWHLFEALDINDSGQIVGNMLPNSSLISYRGFLLTPSAGLLQSMMAGEGIGQLSSASLISQWEGQFSPAVNPVPVMEPAVPEPGSLGVLAMIAAALLRRRRHLAAACAGQS